MRAGQSVSDLAISFSTDGPDYYADGTAVQVGEKYLLVYVEEGAAAFAGINTDETLVDATNNTIVIESLAIEGSKCDFTVVEYPPEMYQGGQFLIVLLDTRNAAGAVGGLVSQVGTSEVEAAASGDSTTPPNSISVAATTGGGGPALVADTYSKAPPAPAPVISRMEGVGGNVSLTIGNVIETARYEVQTTTDLSSGQWVAADVEGCANLQVSAAGEIEVPATVKIPQSDKVRFFRVIVPSL